jgi:hypothetical protein
MKGGTTMAKDNRRRLRLGRLWLGLLHAVNGWSARRIRQALIREKLRWVRRELERENTWLN